MSTVPPTDSFEFAGNSAQNEAALEELASAIVFGQGADTITLLLARCNYGRLRDEMVEQLGQRLAQEELQGPVQVLRLGTDDTNLYAQLQMMQGRQPGAVLVLGTEQLGSLETFLVELNKRREEFRREFPFPLVLWFTDGGYRLLSQFANDFESIAGGETIEFALSGEALTECLRQASGQLFATLLEPETPESFNRRLAQVGFGYLQSDELGLALDALRAQGVELGPELQASVAFAQGLNVLNEAAAELFEQSASYWQTHDPLKYGLSLFYLGRARYYAVDSIKYQSAADWESALPPLRDCVEVFERAERPDLVCKCINQLERVLHRLQQWDELETVAQKAVKLRQRYPNLKKQAENYGFLADVAMQRRQWQRGAELAQLALDTLERQDSWWRMLYLARLAEADYQLGKQESSIAHLKAAQEMGVMEHPTLYSNILTQLQQQLREQRRYLDAFKVKQERLAVEKQYGLRAFIGAGRLRSQRTEQRMTVRSERETLEKIAPEIEASGRKRDLTALLGRIAGRTHKLLVLHGKSGVGKSSLINGGLLPALQSSTLENRRNVPVMMRKYTNWRQTLKKSLIKALEPLHLPGGNFDGMRLGGNLPDVLRRVCEDNTLRPVLLFDQFEEFFFANPNPADRQDFLGFIAYCLELSGALKILFSMREDYLHYLLEARQLVRHAQLPEGSMARAQFEDILGKQVLYEIGNFNREDAKAIIENLASGERMYLEPELIEAVVVDLARPLGEVRPIEMQVVGAQLQTEGIKTLEKYHKLGKQPKETLVQRYLDDVVEDCGEENRQLAQLVLYLLTDERGTRPLKTRPDLVRELEGLRISTIAPNTSKRVVQLDLVLQILCGSGIVLHLPDQPDDRYQLVHDYLAGVIRVQQAPQLEKIVEDLEEKWKKERSQRVHLEGENKDLLFTNKDAQEKSKRIQIELREIENKHRQARRKLSLTTAASAVVILVTVGLTIYRVHTFEGLREIANLEKRWIADSQKSDLKDEKVLFRAFEASKKAHDILTKTWGLDYLPTGTLFGLQTGLNQVYETQWMAHRSSISQVIFSPDGEKIVTCAEHDIARLWDLQGNELAVMGKNGASVEEVLFSPEGTMIATRESDGVARLWDLNGERLGIDLRGHAGGVKHILFNPKNDFLIVTIGTEGSVRLWNLSDERVTTLEGYEGNVRQLSFSPNGKLIATSGDNGTVRLWDLNGEEVANWEGHEKIITQISFSPNGKLIATSGAGGIVRLWDLNGEEVAVMEEHEGLILDMLFSLDGSLIATSGSDHTARVWDIDNGKVTVMKGHEGPVSQVLFSPPDEAQIVTRGSDGTVRLWDLSGKEMAAMEGHEGSISKVSFSPDGKQVATRGSDGTTRLWWLLDGNQIAHHEGVGDIQNNWQYIAATSQGGKMEATGIVKLWPVYTIDRIDELFASACDHLGTYLVDNIEYSDEDRALCGIPPLKDE
ncbi:hypothetical protein IQ260_08815 [Leptolyngbya cf. ectocarpi LEGE 11479]|uniref:Novel STAND NTPase 1 domain-containing protein n=1 Tax=Leptolyngbya cf. ectocarpi LEGE 11479 TaxID=1828722 RepID=A0A928X442_LEPEC|nr:WD40 repeat domain-containing protein [Leptolyngbya ectocarpi]MBE9066753.1 hypothetical protein [Leptolyngbya cf. ectocarpi LEGE 11479]